MKFNSRKYIDEYQKEKYKRVVVRIKHDDIILLDHINKQKNVNKYIKDLVREDMNKKEIYTLSKIKEIILPIFHKREIHDVYLFGSYARGEANKESDIDIYCERGNVGGLIDVSMLKEELQNKLNKEVDLIFSSATLEKTFENSLKKDLIKLC